MNFVDPSGLKGFRSGARTAGGAILGGMLRNAAMGTASGFFGTLFGQILSERLGLVCPTSWQDKVKKSFIGAGVGGVFGSLNPFITTTGGVAASGGLANFTQYALTSWYSGDPFRWDNGINSIIIGGFIGAKLGPYNRIRPEDPTRGFGDPRIGESFIKIFRSSNAATWIDRETRMNSDWAGLWRAMSAGTAGNFDIPSVFNGSSANCCSK